MEGGSVAESEKGERMMDMQGGGRMDVGEWERREGGTK